MQRRAAAATWGSPRTTSAPLMLSTEFSLGTLRAAAGWASSDHGTPRPPWTGQTDRPLKRPATSGPYDAGRWTDGTLSLGACIWIRCAALYSPDRELPVGSRRTAAGSLACSCRAECPVTEHGLRQFQFPAGKQHPQSPHEFCRTDSLSAMESLRLAAGGARRRQRGD
ncbi:hypothetical protein TcBrA4_0105740 [Trypanosoma cruzi]|nr:hypothetical protein TcBrA4_0105740 [Trypanosoma cruzi]